MLDIVGEQLVGGDDDRVVFQDRAAVLVRIDPVGRKIGRVVHRGDGEVHASGRGAALAVADDVVEIGRAPVIVLGRDGDQAVVADGHLDIGIRTDRLDHQRIAIDIGIVGGENARVDGKGAAFGNRGCAVVPGHRRIVDRGDLDEHLGFRAAAFGRVRDIAEFGRAVEVRVGREADVAVARQRGSAVLGAEDLAHDHAVAVEVVRQQAFNANDDIAVFLDRETGVVVGRGDRADTDFDCRRVEAVATVGQRIAERDGAVIAANGGKAHISVGIERGDAVRSAVHRHDAQGIAVGVEVVGKQGRGADHQLLAGDDREGAIGLGIGRTVGETVAQRLRAPGHAVGEGIALDARAVGGERAHDRQAVDIVARDAEHHRVAATRQALDRNVGGIDPFESDAVTRRSAAILDPVVARPCTEGIGIGAAIACQQVVAGACGETVCAAKAVDRVAAGAVGVVDYGGTHVLAVPYGPVGEVDGEIAIVGVGQRTGDRQAIPADLERQDQIVAVRPRPANAGQVRRIEVDQLQQVRPAAERLDPVVAVALGIDVIVAARAAAAEVVAEAALERILAIGSGQHVVAVGRLLRHHEGGKRGEVERRTVLEYHAFHAAVCDQAVDDHHLVGRPREAQYEIVAIGTAAMCGHRCGSVAVDFQHVPGRG